MSRDGRELLCATSSSSKTRLLAAFDIQGTLKPAGATSFAFADSEREALDEARRRRPDVIISDFMLIEGSGPAAVRAIRAELGDIPVIFVTAIPEYLEEGDDVLVVEKPFSQPQLIGLFRSVAPL